MFTFLQRSFAGGEISPDFWGKPDLPKYGMSLKTCRNFIVDRFGNVCKRLGTLYKGNTKSNNQCRLICFYITQQQGVLLEFTNGYLRFWYNGQLLTNLNGGGQSYLVSPYATANLPFIKFRQPPGNTMYFVDGGVSRVGTPNPPYELILNQNGSANPAAWTWTLQKINFVPSIDSDYSVITGTPFPSNQGNVSEQYRVTIEDLATGEESYPMPAANTPTNEIQLLVYKPTGALGPSAASIPITWNGVSGTIGTSGVTAAALTADFCGFSNVGAGNAVVTLNFTSGTSASNNNPYNPPTYSNNYYIEIQFQGALVGHQPLITTSDSRIFTVAELQNGQSAGNNQVQSIVATSNLYITVTLGGAHYLKSGDQVLFYETTVPQLDNRVFNVVVTGANTVQVWLDASQYTNLPLGATGYMQATTVTLVTGGASAIAPNTITWAYNGTGSLPNQVTYNIYKGNNGVFGFIGTTQALSFNDNGITPDYALDPPSNPQRFVTSTDYPSAIEMYQQRLVFGAPQQNPLEILASRVGFYTNFTDHYNIQSNDAIDVTLEALHGGMLQNFVNFGFLICMADTGEIVIAGDASGTFTPLAATSRPQTFMGSASLAPIKTNQNVIYLQAQTSLVRDLSVTISPYGFTYISGSDELTMMAQHLVKNHAILDWDWQKLLNSIIYPVRDDGTLLGLTYIKEQQIVAWHHHDTQGAFENICQVPEGFESAVYYCVNRTVNGITSRCIERLSTDLWTTIDDANYMDCVSVFDGRVANQAPGTSMTITGGTKWDTTELLTLTFSGTSFFTSQMVGNEIFLYGPDGYLVRFLIEEYTDGQHVNGTVRNTVPDGVHSFDVDKTVFDNMRAVAISNWSWAVNSVSGLGYLYGPEIIPGVFADGQLVCSPNNPNNPNVLTITSGGVMSLPENYAVIHVGIPYISDIQTLDIDDPKGETFLDKKMQPKRFVSFVKDTMGFFVGHLNPDTNPKAPQNLTGPIQVPNLVYGLVEAKMRKDENYDNPTKLTTDRILTNIPSKFDYGSTIFIRSVDPIPCNFEAIGVASDFQTGGK